MVPSHSVKNKSRNTTSKSEVFKLFMHSWGLMWLRGNKKELLLLKVSNFAYLRRRGGLIY